MNNTLPSNRTIFFLCSPSLGILDNWLPVMWQLKEKSEEIKFVIIFPKPNAIDQINLSSVLITLSNDIFDAVLIKSFSDYWLSYDNFSQLKEKEKSIKIQLFFSKTIRKIKENQTTKTLGVITQYIYEKFYKYKNRKKFFDWKNIENYAECVLFDLSEEIKPYNLEILKNFKNTPKFSIQHGINIDNGGILVDKKKSNLESTRTDLRAYLFSSKEEIIYQYKHAVNKKFIKVVGVPRHAPDWVNLVQLKSLKDSDANKFLDTNYIFIISRPGNTVYHSRERKRKALQDIKELVWYELKQKIVIKIHPKERKEGIYEEVFGLEEYGDKWIFSDLHPFVLGKGSTFAISFYSGVAIDMIALGVPTIEYLDLRGISQYDNNQSLRDEFGHPVLSYRYLGLVLGVSDHSQLKAYATEIINNRSDVIARLRLRYEKFFPKIRNINTVIANDIINFNSKYSPNQSNSIMVKKTVESDYMP